MKPGFSVCVRALSGPVRRRCCGRVFAGCGVALIDLPVGLAVSVEFQAARMVCSRVMLYARLERVNSLFTFCNPRVRN